MNVSDDIVNNDMCIGCGVCASLCPGNNLEMIWKNGKYEVFLKSNACPLNCSLCLKVCPFSDKSKNEDEISKELYANIENISLDSQCGYYLKSYVGYHPKFDRRLQSASGGLTTYLLETLLKTEVIDYVACVGKTNNKSVLFDYRICSSINDLHSCKGSVYYPVEASKIIHEILKHEGRYAVVALPCISKAIRNAMKNNKLLKQRILFIVGLVCGQTKTEFFTQYLANRIGLNTPFSVNFRKKCKNLPIKNYTIEITDLKGQSKSIKSSEVSMEWSDRWFTPNPCNFCDDIFAETADVVIMDAWLPDYSNSVHGYNLVLNRNPSFDKIFNGIDNVREMPISLVKSSQELVIISKRQDILARIKQALKSNSYIPKKRYHLFEKTSFERNFIVSYTYYVSKLTQKYWQESGGNFLLFKKLTRALKLQLTLRRQIYRAFKMLNKLKGLI